MPVPRLIGAAAMLAFVVAALALRTRRRALTAAAAAYAGGAVVFFVGYGVAARWHNHGVDFAQYIAGAACLTEGRDPYAAFRTYVETRGNGPLAEMRDAGLIPVVPAITYPPPFYAAVSPLLLLPYEDAFHLWTLANVAALAAAVIISCKALGIENRMGVATALALTFTSYPALDNLYHGQTSGIVTLALGLFWWGAARGRAPAAAGGVLGAAFVKGFPAFAALIFLTRRAWRAAVYTAVGAIILIAATAAIWSPAIWANYLRVVVLPFAKVPDVDALNVAVATIPARFAATNEAAILLFGAGKVLASLIAVAAVVAAGRRSVSPERAAAAAVAAACVASNHVSPSYLLYLTIPFIVLGKDVAGGRLSVGGTCVAAAAFLLVALDVDLSPYAPTSLRQGVWAMWPQTLLLLPKPLGVLGALGATLTPLKNAPTKRRNPRERKK